MKDAFIKRLLSMFLAILMVVGVAPVTVFANVLELTEDGVGNVSTEIEEIEAEIEGNITESEEAIAQPLSIPDWKDNNVIFEGTSFGTNGYYNVISKKDYVLVPGAAVESEMVLNNATGTRRQVLHIIEVDPSNPDVSIVPGYYQIDKDLEDEANWSHKELTEMAKYYEDTLGYNIVGGMNTDLYYNSYSPRVLVYNGKWIGNAHENVATGGAVLNPTASILYVFKDAEGNVSCDVKAYNKADVDKYLEEGILLHAVGVSFAMVVKDGVLVSTKEARGTDDAARSMVGVKEDGTLVIVMNDGRGANNSVGLSSYEEGEVMLALGCKWAANCDGGGSSTFLSKRVGEETFEMRSVPCDGAQRPTAHGIFVASNVAPTGILNNVNVESDYDIFASGTVYTFGAAAIDTHGYAMDMPADVSWTLSDASFGSVENGKFVSNGKAGIVDIQVISGGKVVGSKTITIAKPEVFKLSATSTVVPYSTEEKIRTISLPIVAMTGEANVYVDINVIKVSLSNNAAGILDGFNFTATTDESIAGVDVTITYGEIVLTYAIEFGKGSEIIWDFEDGDKAGFMGFEEAKKWSQDNEVNNTLVGSAPLAGQFNEYLSSTTDVVTEEDGGQVRNGNYALKWTLDNSDASFASWSYNVLFNVGETIVLRDVANGKKATTLGMWIYIPENAFPSAGKGLAFQSQLYVKNADGSYSCKQDHFMFTSAATGKSTNLNSATNADIPESRWVYATIDISKYDYLCTPVATDEGNSRSPSFIRTYVKPDTADVVTFYIDDITLDYSSAVDDRIAPVISNPKYGIEVDTAIKLENGATIDGSVVHKDGAVRFLADVSDNEALNIKTGKIFIDGIEVPTAAGNSRGISTEQRYVLNPGVHTVTFEIKDELGNPARLTRTFTVAGDAVVELSGHNDSEEAPKAQSIYYVDINVADLANTNKVVTQLKLNNSNTWETKGAVVANGFKATFDYNEISELLTVTVEADGTDKATEGALVSIPVRVWTFDRYNYVTNTYYAPAEMGNKPVVNVDCEIVYGTIDDAPFGGAINVATELATISSPYHVHDVELTVLNKEATTAEAGYENRTYCETCQSVVEWGTILEKLEVTHNYEIVDGKFVCSDEDCGAVYVYTGVFEMNGSHYYAIAGNLLRGWQTIEAGKYCFAYGDYKLATGEATINGVTYDFGETCITEGAWVETENGTRFSYGADYYRCGAGNPHANAVWVTISGETYAFNREGYRHEGVCMLVESNNPGKVYEFTEEGVFVGEYVTDFTGIFVCNNGTTYLENGIPVAAGLIKEDGYYYYINSGYLAVTGEYDVSRTNNLLPAGKYVFDENGRMLNPPEVKHGVQADGYLYIDGVRQDAYQLIEFEGNYYFVSDGHKVAKNARVYLSAHFLEGTRFTVGYYEFDAEGKLIIKHGVQADGYLYIDGVRQDAYQLIEFEGAYYFVSDGHKVAKNARVYLSAHFLEGTRFT
ncbi:MAG: phosphodiester glycosidase family protein, partial [Oscillospiraceae bacterium]|nr:phosphodiester glycosidase family protein [Oscillospiraceae bacterium]